MERPAAPAPTLIVPTTFLSLRSTTLMRSSGTVLVGSAGSILLDEATSASCSSGVIATDNGGPTTLPGTLSTVPTTLTGEAPRSMIVMVSGDGLATVLVTPFSCVTLWSFEDTAICACTGANPMVNATQTPRTTVLRMFSSRSAPLGGALEPGGSLAAARGRTESLLVASNAIHVMPSACL